MEQHRQNTPTYHASILQTNNEVRRIRFDIMAQSFSIVPYQNMKLPTQLSVEAFQFSIVTTSFSIFVFR